MIYKTLLQLGLLVIGAMGLYPSPNPSYSLPNIQQRSSCPSSFKDPPLILVSMDGFRAEYLSRGLTPTIQSLGVRGVRAPYIKASYPTVTFPNHYTIVTGLYPPVHGIIANKFYDPEFNAEFRVGRPSSLELRFWGGEPIWKTVENQGKVAATFFWPGSDVTGNHPTFWFPYNMTTPFEQRVDQVLAWLEMPPKMRPSFMTLYMHEPDSSGHMYGPSSIQVDKILRRVDNMVKRLVMGLKRRQILDCVNLVVVADHGMADAGQDKIIKIHNYIPRIKERSRFWEGTVPRFAPNDGSQATKQQMLNALSCKRPEFRVYEKSSLPVRWHMGTQRRVEDIVIDLDAGFSVAGDDAFVADEGDHGYDNYFPSMNALFLAHGPSFKQNLEVEAFQNIELYNLMCHLVKVTPAPNNGTWGALHHLLVNPPAPPHKTFEYPPRAAYLPSEDESEGYEVLAQDMGCDGDGEENEGLLETLREVENDDATKRKHLPWGHLHMGALRDHSVLLTQPDTIAAYSLLVKMPLYTSFTLDGKHYGSSRTLWRSDLRFPPGVTATCATYQYLRQYNISQQPLFPPEFSSSNEYEQLPFLMTNAVPLKNQLTFRWRQLLSFLPRWTKQYGNLNVVMGPVFDYDGDTFADDLTQLRGEVVVPTHTFLVVTRCMVWVDHLSECPHSHLDSLAFIYPQALSVSNCLSDVHFAREFSATVQDVEKITGLKFYSSLNYYDQVRLRIRIHSNIWGYESWWNRLRSDVYGVHR